MCPAGILTAKYSHVKNFPNRPAYDDYYDIMNDISEIGVHDLAQALLVDHLRAKYGYSCADWCREISDG